MVQLVQSTITRMFHEVVIRDFIDYMEQTFKKPLRKGNMTYTWVSASNGSVPADAVVMGKDKDGSYLFGGRAMHEGHYIPAKISPSHGGAFIALNGTEISKFEYDVLCGWEHVAWQRASNGKVPSRAISAGSSEKEEPLYIGRVLHDGCITPGKVHPSHGVLYIPYGGQELNFKEYEVLIHV